MNSSAAQCRQIPHRSATRAELLARTSLGRTPPSDARTTSSSDFGKDTWSCPIELLATSVEERLNPLAVAASGGDAGRSLQPRSRRTLTAPALPRHPSVNSASSNFRYWAAVFWLRDWRDCRQTFSRFADAWSRTAGFLKLELRQVATYAGSPALRSVLARIDPSCPKTT